MTESNKSGTDHVNDLVFTESQILQLRDTMLPLAEAHTLPAWCYSSAEFIRRRCARSS